MREIRIHHTTTGMARSSYHQSTPGHEEASVLPDDPQMPGADMPVRPDAGDGD